MARLAATLDAFIAVDGITHAKMRSRRIVGARRIVPCASSKTRPPLPWTCDCLDMLVYIRS